MKVLPGGKHVSRYEGNINKTKSTDLRKLNDSEQQVPYVGGAGMVSTMSDLLIWNHHFYQGKVLSPASFEEMTKIQMSGYSKWFGNSSFGYGLKINHIDGQKIYNHAGWVSGIKTELSYNPANNVSVIIFSNVAPPESIGEKELVRQLNSLTTLCLNALEAPGITINFPR